MQEKQQFSTSLNSRPCQITSLHTMSSQVVWPDLARHSCQPRSGSECTGRFCPVAQMCQRKSSRHQTLILWATPGQLTKHGSLFSDVSPCIQRSKRKITWGNCCSVDIQHGCTGRLLKQWTEITSSKLGQLWVLWAQSVHKHPPLKHLCLCPLLTPGKPWLMWRNSTMTFSCSFYAIDASSVKNASSVQDARV